MCDLAVIGAGWAGFNAAVRAAELGLKVVLIDKDRLGGTCLNYGCIPTKSLIQSAKVYALSQKSADFGVEIAGSKIILSAAVKRKDLLVSQLNSGMQFILKSKRITFVSGQARVISPKQISVGSEMVETANILVATGSRPIELFGLKFDNKKVISSDAALELTEIPKSILIVGGGVIGCEFAGFFNAIGSKVSIVELLPQILPTEDTEIARKLEAIFKKKGISVHTETDINTLDLGAYDRVLVAVGRRAEAAGLGLEELGVKLEKGKVLTDEHLATNVPGIYAAGDCTGKIMLAHYASYQGRVAAENIARPKEAKTASNANIPSCVFTDPEIASVGITQEAARERNLEVMVKKTDFRASGMAHVLDEADGFIKVISDKKSGIILGASIIGPKATELIAILGLAVQSRLTVSLVKDTVFAHPTLSEIIHDAL
ncbi:MAG: dihydrolipoyl dehydrogenase [Candidatus Omnitrophica bacterium]|nr:dihydrolipoyl dehydrogenase [Candidatus Omnitrophota bacterium]